MSDRMLSEAEVLAKTGKSRRTLFRWQQLHGFPRAGCGLYSEQVVTAWLRDWHAERTSPPRASRRRSAG